MEIAEVIHNSNLFRIYQKSIMRKFSHTSHQPASMKPWLVTMLLSAALFTLPAFAEPVAADAGNDDTGLMIQPVWQQDENKLDDTDLGKIHGKGMEFIAAQPQLIPAVILWDESGKGRNTGTSRTSIRISVSGAATNTR